MHSAGIVGHLLNAHCLLCCVLSFVLRSVGPHANRKSQWWSVRSLRCHSDCSTASALHTHLLIDSSPLLLLWSGQKSRLAFSIICWKEPHVLIMDEPTNHLEYATHTRQGGAVASDTACPVLTRASFLSPLLLLLLQPGDDRRADLGHQLVEGLRHDRVARPALPAGMPQRVLVHPRSEVEGLRHVRRVPKGDLQATRGLAQAPDT